MALESTPDGFDRERQESGVSSGRFEFRFVTIWFALAGLFLLSALIAPASIQGSTLSAVLPFFAFLAVASMGEAIVVMTGGLDISVAGIITVVGVFLVAVSGGADANLAVAIVAVLAVAAMIGAVNGILVAIFQLNVLLVTLTTNMLSMGAVLWYFSSLRRESSVPPALSAWAAEHPFGVSFPVWVAIAVMLVLTVALNHTSIGRRFKAVGANPIAAWAAGIPVERYQIGAFAVAGLLYGITGIMLSAFIRNPGRDSGTAYMLAPLAAVVVGTGSFQGGVGSMVATVGGALFLTQLSQVLKDMGLPLSAQYIVNGVAIAAGMTLASGRISQVGVYITRVIRRISGGGDEPSRAGTAREGPC